jgi:hypothetical protein
MKVGHAKHVAALEEKAKHAKDPELKAWAAQTLPTLKKHKQHLMAMMGDKDHAGHGEAKPAGSRSEGEQQQRSDGEGTAGGADSSGGTSSSGTDGRQTGSGTTTGGGTTGAGSQ